MERDIACQDVNDHRRAESADGGQWLFVAVADGAGSAERSDEGADAAVTEALKTATQNMSREAFREDAESPLEDLKDLLASSVKAAISAVEKLAEGEGAKPADFSSTLLLLAAGPSCAAAAQVGDGAVVYKSTDGKYGLMTEPQSGEYHNQTTFITSDGVKSEIDIQCVTDTPGRFALFTDGVGQVALDMSEMEPHPPFFEPLFQFSVQADASEEKLEKFLKSSRFGNHTDDDLTLLLASRLRKPDTGAAD